MQKRGFTLIELMIVVSIMGLVMTGLSQIIKLSSQAYSINIELNDAMSRINPVLNRLQKRMTEANFESPPFKSPEILDIYSDSEELGIKLQVPFDINNSGDSTDDIYWYWWNKEDKNLYRSESDNSNDNPSLADGNQDIPLFRSKNELWENGTVSIENFSFEFYEVNSQDQTLLLEGSINENKINYIRIKISIIGEVTDFGEPTTLKFSTGFRVNEN
ncbi:MAG: PilW family protein [Fusobacteriota bacterium]